MAKPKFDSRRKKQRGTSANSAHAKVLPTTHWANAVAMIAEKNEAALRESRKPLPEDFSAADFDIVRARNLSSQI